MPIMNTTSFGPVPYSPDAVVEFPRGLPGFDDRRRFVAVRFPESDPTVFLQSLEDPGLCFVTLPVRAVDPEYRLEICSEDVALVGLPAGRRPRLGEDVLCLSVISLRESGPSANLLAPLVINLRNRKAVQAIAVDSGYSHRYPLGNEVGHASARQSGRMNARPRSEKALCS
jgi:flagellar assembly factor FliW